MRHSAHPLSHHPRFAPLVKKHGLPQLRHGRAPFQALCRAIIYQQISGSAAGSIYKKFVAVFGIAVTLPLDWKSKKTQAFPTPEEVLATPLSRMRTAGLSAQKASYIQDLARKFSDGSITPRKLSRMKNDDIVETLTQVKGIGVWTVHMFLIFTLNRPDILPTGDLGIRKGFQKLYALRTLPTHTEMERLAKEWREHASAASWYLWRIADEQKPVAKKSALKKRRV